MELFGTLKGLLLTGAVVAASTTAALAEFPERNIEIFHPWGPGNAMAMSQVVAKAMGEELGTDMPVISLPGAAGTKAQTTAMGKPADGYTIFDGYVAPLVLQPILGNADWNFKDFKPLSAAVANAFAIAGQVDEGRWSNFEEMMAFCKENRGELRYSSGSRNNLPHMVIAKALQSYDCVAQNVPYTQDGNVFKDLASKVLDFAFVNVGNYRSNPDKVKILLVLSELESSKKAYDGAPTIGELGVDLGLSNLGPMGWTWWIVNSDTPDDVTEKLRGAMERAMAQPEVIAAVEAIGFVPLNWDHTMYEEIVGGVDSQLNSMGNALSWEELELKKLN